MTNSVTIREEFNKDFVIIVPKPSWRGIEKNLKFVTKAGHGVQSEGEKRLIEDYKRQISVNEQKIKNKVAEVWGE